MPVTLTITGQDTELGLTRDAAGKAREKIKIVCSASAAGDTGTYVPTYIRRNAIIPGGVFTVSESIASSGVSTLTITAIPALSSNTVYAEIIGDTL